MENLDKIKSIIQTIFENNEMSKIIDISNASTLREDLEMDSIMLAEFSVRIEDEYGVDVFERGMINTIGEVLEILKH